MKRSPPEVNLVEFLRIFMSFLTLKTQILRDKIIFLGPHFLLTRYDCVASIFDT